MAKKEYSKKEAAELLNSTPAAIQKRIERKKVEAFKNDKKEWRVMLSDEEIKAEKAPKKSKAAAKPAAKKATKTKAPAKTKTANKPKAAAKPKPATKAKAAAKAKPATKEKPAAKPAVKADESASAFSGESVQSVKPEYVEQYQTDCMAEFQKDMADSSTLPANLISSFMDIASDLKNKVEDTTNIIMEKMEIQRDEAKKVAEQIVEKGESQKNIYMFKLLENIESIRNKIVTRYDIERLESKIESLTKKLKR